MSVVGLGALYPLEESMEAMAQVLEEGKTRYIGVGNTDAEQMRVGIAAIGRYHCAGGRQECGAGRGARRRRRGHLQ